MVDALTALKAQADRVWCRPIPTISTRRASPIGKATASRSRRSRTSSTSGSAFHPIYSLGGSAAAQALRTLEDKPLDAIVMLGTGMPTLRPIADAIGWQGAPVMSCNLCLAWRAVEALDGQTPRARDAGAVARRPELD